VDESGTGTPDRQGSNVPALDDGTGPSWIGGRWKADEESQADVGGEGPDGEEPPPRHRLRRVLLFLLGAFVVLVACAVGGLYYLTNQLGNEVDRIPGVFAGLPASQRPTKPVSGPGADAVNILLAGSDTRSAAQTTGNAAAGTEWAPGAQRSDTIMILHIDGDRQHASLISIPRDSWVNIPGFGMNKINAAFSFGGPSLYVKTIEHLTDLRIDHLAVIDLQGFANLTDALGGVTVDIPQTVTNTLTGKVWHAGVQTLNGKQALLYVRQRHGLPGGDFDRIKRQQYFLRQLMRQTLSAGTLVNPFKFHDALSAVAQNLSVDDEFSNGEMRSLAFSLRDLRSDDVDFLTVPLKGTGTRGTASVVVLDKEADRSLFQAVRIDDVGTWLATHDADTLGATVN
jgi:LCP family protein required for cell wall assembly